MARPIEALNGLALQGGKQDGGVDAVVLNGISRAHQLGMLQPRDGVQQFLLHLLRQAGGEALEIQLFRVQAAGLHKNLVSGLVREADNFGLDAGTVPGPHPLDGAIEQGAPVQVIPDDGMGVFVGIGEVAYGLILDCPCGRKRKGFWDVVSRL